MGKQDPPPSDSFIFSDRARRHSDDDDLGRKGFVKSFWKALRAHDASESVVIGIQAPWGDGKTTFKNMVHQLETDEGDSTKLVFVHFNPWEWASRNQVAEAFFRELDHQIYEGTTNIKSLSKVEQLSKTLKNLSSHLGIFGVIFGGTSVALAPYDPGLAAAAAAAAASIKVAQQQTKVLQESQKAISPSDLPSIETVKRETRAIFEEYRERTKVNIVVIIDDIDRLDPNEIRHVLQLVKINADFPGLIFLLLYDKDYVQRSLEMQFQSAGKDFLEKIVQFELTLPTPPDGVFLQALNKGMTERLSALPHYSSLLSESRVKSAFDCCLNLYITNPRKLGRLLTTWSFHLGVFESAAAEINPVDLLILDALLIFEPKVHKNLSCSIAELFPSAVLSLADFMNSSASGPGRRMQALVRTAKPAGDNQSSVIELLKLLMGVTGSDFHRPNQYEENEHLREVRLCHPDFFRRYFRLSIDSGDVSNAVVQDLADLRKDPPKFIEKLDKLEFEGCLLDVLDRLLALPADLSLEKSLFVASLMTWWEKRLVNQSIAPRNTSGDFDLENRMRRLYIQALGQTDGDERLQTFLDIFEKTLAVFSFVKVVISEGHRNDIKSQHGTSDGCGCLSSTMLETLKEKVIMRLSDGFQKSTPRARTFEVEPVLWALVEGRSRKTRIEEVLLGTPGGTVTLLMATVGSMDAPANGLEGDRLKRFLSNIIDLGKLTAAIKSFEPQLATIHPRAVAVAATLSNLVFEASGAQDADIKNYDDGLEDNHQDSVGKT